MHNPLVLKIYVFHLYESVSFSLSFVLYAAARAGASRKTGFNK